MSGDRRARGQRPQDYPLLSLTLLLVVLGVAMMSSASAMYAYHANHDSLYYVKRQLAWTLLGLGVMSLMSRIDYHRLRAWRWPAFGACCALLLAVLKAPPVENVHRWLRLGPVGLQPAELAKPVAVLILADYLDRKRSKVQSLVHGFLMPWGLVGVLLVLIAKEPDLGIPALIFATTAAMLFVGGSRIVYLAGAGLSSLPVLAFEIHRKAYRAERLKNFLHPSADPQNKGYQVFQSLLAVGSGGWLGVGLGNSRIKLDFLPKCHTDFIYSIVCEELGLVGALAVVFLFAAFLLRGLRVASRAPDLFGSLLVWGLTLSICVQAFFNIAMTIGLMPTKGIPLPFFSYGGSSMVLTLAMVGVILNVSRSCERDVR